MSTAPLIALSRLDLPDIVADSDSDSRQSIEGPVLVKAFQGAIQHRQALIKNQINETARAVLLATASAGALDQVAALYGIKRLQITPADPKASPPVEAVMESDDRLRLRARLSLQAMTQSGCEGAYLFYALSASARIKDISVYNEEHRPEKINMVVLSDHLRGDSSTENDGILTSVREAMQRRASVTDTISVRWATIVECPVEAKLTIQPGYDAETIYKEVVRNTQNLLKENHRLGKNIIRNEFFSAMYLPGVECVNLIKPDRDIAVGIDSAPYNNGSDEDKAMFNIVVNRMPDKNFIFQLPEFYQLLLRQSRRINLTASVSFKNAE